MATVKDFSVQEKLASLVRLQKIESKLDEMSILKGELPMEVADLEDELQGLHHRRTRIEEEINGINEFVDQKKASIVESEELIKKYEAQSNNVKNSREFEAINKEIEMQQLEVKLAEKHIKDAQEELQEKARRLDSANKAIQTKEGTLAAKKGELEKIIADTEKEELHYKVLPTKPVARLKNACWLLTTASALTTAMAWPWYPYCVMPAAVALMLCPRSAKAKFASTKKLLCAKTAAASS